MRVNNFALRLPDSLYQALKQSAEKPMVWQ